MIFIPKIGEVSSNDVQWNHFTCYEMEGDSEETMAFSSLNFLFVFLPAFLGIYYLVPVRYRNWPLLAGSLVFYSYGVQTRPWVMVLFLLLTGMTFLAGRVVEPEAKRPRAMLAVFLGILAGCLLGFKCAGLFTTHNPVLPLGISFFSFQLMAYLMDVYWGKVSPERSFQKFFTAIALFPKLISGPITPYGSIARQLERRSFVWQRFDYGLRDFVLGLGMKVLLANQIGGIWRQVEAIGIGSISTPMAWLGIVGFSLQLYFDFFGYSLMAIGLGRMIGFRLPKNFVTPYASHSVSEFWRRWHITLGKWFLEYVYIPLGGNQKGKVREVRNLLIVWVLTGIWHGSTLNFLLWGLYIFLFMVIEKLWLERYLEESRVWSHVYLISVILISWLIFAVTDLNQLGLYFTRIFPFFGGAQIPNGDFFRMLDQYGVSLTAGIIASTPGFMRFWDRIRQNHLGTMFLVAIFWCSVYFLSAGLNDPFLYFSF